MLCPICDGKLIKGKEYSSCRVKTTYANMKVNHYKDYGHGLKIAIISGTKIIFGGCIDDYWDGKMPATLEIEGASEGDFDTIIKKYRKLAAFK